MKKTTSIKSNTVVNTVIRKEFWIDYKGGYCFKALASVQLLDGEAKVILHNKKKDVQLVAVQGGQFGWKIAFCSGSKTAEKIARTLMNQHYAC